MILKANMSQSRMPTLIDLSLCIVNWNTGPLLEQCLSSIKANTQNIIYEVIVVDNHSTDDSFMRCVAQYGDDPNFCFVHQERNLGFAAANNVALKIAQGRYVVLLNPDTLVHKLALESAVSFLDANPDCGVLGPRLLNGDGTLQHSIGHFPSVSGAFWEATRLRKFFPSVRRFSSFKRVDMNYEQQQEVDQPSGACLFARSTVVSAVGLLDERFFMYYEEVDWCFRIKQAGWRIVYDPDVVITHYGGQSSAKNLDVRILENLRSRLLYFTKHYRNRPLSMVMIRVIMLVEIVGRSLIVLGGVLLHPRRGASGLPILHRYQQAAKVVLGFG